MRDGAEGGQGGAWRGRGEDHTLPHLGAEDVEPRVPVDIGDLDVRDRRRAHHVHRQGSPREAQRRFTGGWPRFRRGQPLRSPARVERQDLLHVRWQLHVLVGDPRRADRRKSSVPDEHHPHELVAPGAARQDVGRRKLVTRGADSAGLRFDITGLCGCTPNWFTGGGVDPPQRQWPADRQHDSGGERGHRQPAGGAPSGAARRPPDDVHRAMLLSRPRDSQHQSGAANALYTEPHTILPCGVRPPLCVASGFSRKISAGCAVSNGTAAHVTKATATAARPILRRCGRLMPIARC